MASAIACADVYSLICVTMIYYSTIFFKEKEESWVNACFTLPPIFND
jgi:hypothetical protein